MSKSFQPLQNFYSPEMNSQYLCGFTYLLREGNEKLAAQVARWVEEGKVRFVEVGAKISGQGEVR